MSDVPPPPSFPPPPPNLTPPPGYVHYGSSDAPASRSFQRVGGVAKALGILLMIYIPLQLLAIAATIRLSGRAKDYLNGEISESEFRDATRLNAGGLSGLLIIPIAVLTMILMYRMAQNLRTLGRSGQTWSPGWAIGGWFCPPLVVYAIPWLMFRELWKGSDPDIAPSDHSWKQAPVSPLVNAWWVLYGLVPLIGIATAAGVFANIVNASLDDLAERIDDYLVINSLLGVASVAAAIVYLLMVRQLSQRHMRSTRELLA